MMKQKTTGHRRIPSRLLGVSLLLAGMSLVPVSGPVWAREGATAATFGLVDEAPHTFLRPKQVSLFPTHALVQGEEELEVRVRDGVGRVELFVPENARNLQFDLGDVRLASWRSRVAPAAVADGDARRRQDLLARKRAVEGELEAVSARLGLWTAHAGERSLEALEKLDARMAEVIPRLRERQAALQRELKTISNVLASLPRVTESGQLVILLLDGAPAGKVRVRYAYTLDNSGWDPVYDLDARPEEGTVRVLLTARLRQNSGMDWRGCDLSIVWQDARPLDAPALPVWPGAASLRPGRCGIQGRPCGDGRPGRQRAQRSRRSCAGAGQGHLCPLGSGPRDPAAGAGTPCAAAGRMEGPLAVGGPS